MPRSQTTRRRILGACGVGVAGLVSGCVGAGVLGESEASTQLSELHLGNSHVEAHSIDLIVRRDGELVHWTSHELDGVENNVSDGETLDLSWSETPGSYVISARLDGAENWETFALSDLGDAPCYRLLVKIDHEGRLGIWSMATPDACGDESTTPTA
ncbi:hypothetical protein AUR64_17815 [Haloprofundus marisrubri]|uniref:Uncharacterized protein n=1 Tax=Haloprofundus marisrubri TaxID=1514971 RepID=A0A0W1R548_9EURY|nr:hypothetical protein [Haloprofundus marisrubri]KTG08534.1 hypothetical protein AUR64_17815 [Haloprofundus marisrubri]